jgi:hypothetical protein
MKNTNLKCQGNIGQGFALPKKFITLAVTIRRLEK